MSWVAFAAGAFAAEFCSHSWLMTVHVVNQRIDQGCRNIFDVRVYVTDLKFISNGSQV